MSNERRSLMKRHLCGFNFSFQCNHFECTAVSNNTDTRKVSLNTRIYFQCISKCLRPILMRFPIFISILHSPQWNLLKKQKKSRKIVFPILVTSVCYQKGLNPQIVENKEIHRNLYKNRRVKLMWVLGFYMWHLSLTTKLSEFIKCNMVIVQNGDFLRTM